MTAAEVRVLLRKRIGNGSQAAFAREVGVCRAHICAMLAGTRKPYGKVLDALGLRSVEQYVPKRKAAK